jgi:hypothetical protein
MNFFLLFLISTMKSIYDSSEGFLVEFEIQSFSFRFKIMIS